MLYRWRKAARAWMFNRELAEVLKLPPLVLKDAGPAIVSMVSLPDLPMYLLALRSLYAQLRRGKVVAIVRQDSPAELIGTLRNQVIGIEIVEIETIPTGECPRGGCWERLLFIVDRTSQDFVIQMDSDTLVTGDHIDEVIACVRDGRSFTLGGGPRGSGQAIVTMREAALSLDFDSDYIGIVAQRRFGSYPEADRCLYVRGSAAFAGFAKGSCERGRIEHFHKNMMRLLGARWSEWGSEQCASNFAVANAPKAAVLPYPDYINLELNSDDHRYARFLHFRGAVRYKNGVYAGHARQALRRLAANRDAATTPPSDVGASA